MGSSISFSKEVKNLDLEEIQGSDLIENVGVDYDEMPCCHITNLKLASKKLVDENGVAMTQTLHDQEINDINCMEDVLDNVLKYYGKTVMFKHSDKTNIDSNVIYPEAYDSYEVIDSTDPEVIIEITINSGKLFRSLTNDDLSAIKKFVKKNKNLKMFRMPYTFLLSAQREAIKEIESQVSFGHN